MSAHPNSPNGCWERNGYRIERSGKRRKVFSPDGALIFDHGQVGYDAEMEYIRLHGMLINEAA